MEQKERRGAYRRSPRRGKERDVQTIVDFDGNFEIRFTAPLVKPVALELNPPAEAQAEPERSDEPQIPTDPAFPPSD